MEKKKLYQSPVSSSPVPSSSAKDSHGLFLVAEKEEVQFSTKFQNEIGRGSFGIVYKGVWARTDAAMKNVKFQNAKCQL